MVHYRSLATMNGDLLKWLAALPRDIDIVVGVPRSGVLVANLISLYVNIPLTDVKGLLEGRVMEAGDRFKGADTSDLLSQKRRVLLVDDSVHTGKQIQSVKAEIDAAQLPHDMMYGAVYVYPESKDQVDFYYEQVPGPRLFEWNIFQHGSMDEFCIDLDGVLCRDPTADENDDGEKYKEFIQNVKPSIVPTSTIGYIVTCRLEKYRRLTEEWLEKHGIQYNELVMMDFPDKQARVRAGMHASYKAEIYKRSNAILFIESSIRQSQEIAELTGKDVLCFETREMASPHQIGRQYHRFGRFLRLISMDPHEAWRLFCRRLIPRR